MDAVATNSVALVSVAESFKVADKVATSFQDRGRAVQSSKDIVETRTMQISEEAVEFNSSKVIVVNAIKG